MTPPLFSPLGLGPSVLPSLAFDNCRATADVLMTPWDDTITFDRVLQMAMSYHEVACTFREPKHSFLLLWVIFETLFKALDDEIPRAVKCLSQLLARDRNHQRLITRRFNNGVASYTKIRNSIAHGDVSLESVAVARCYPDLYAYITNAITQLLLMRNSAFDLKQDYYEEISKVSKERFINL